ncbi:alpha/beta hydrolase family protein [Streptomyces sp. NPDC002078]
MQELISQLNSWAESVEEVVLSDSMPIMQSPNAQKAQDNAEHVRAFKFRYRSSGLLVGGFLVAPRSLGEPLPAIIFNRGGFKDFGSVPDGRLLLLLADMAQWGYVVVGSQYPGNSRSEGHDERGGATDVQSILDLHELIKRLDAVDAGRVAMYGESRGGMMTTLALQKAPWVRVAATVGGEFNAFRSAELRPQMQNVMNEAFGGDEVGKRARSAVFWADQLPKTVPLLMVHGANDQRVSPLSSIELSQKLWESGNTNFRLLVLDNDDHGVTVHRDEAMRQVRQWFDAFV